MSKQGHVLQVKQQDDEERRGGGVVLEDDHQEALFATDHQVPAESLSTVPVLGTSIATDTIASSEMIDMGAQKGANIISTTTNSNSKKQEVYAERHDNERGSYSASTTRLKKMRLGKTSDKFAVGRQVPASSIGAVAVPGTATIITPDNDETITSSMTSAVVGVTTTITDITSSSTPEDHSDIVPTIVVAQLVPDDNELVRRLQFLEEERNLQITVSAVPVEANKTGIDPASNRIQNTTATTKIMGLPKRTFWCFISVLLIISAAVIVMAVVLPGPKTSMPDTRAIDQLWLSVGDEIDKEGGSWNTDPESTQYKALDWLANEDQWWDSLEVEVPIQVLVERYALVALLLSTQAEYLDPTTSVCSWATEIVCDDNDEFVTELNFPQSQTNGTIPTDVGLLTTLVSFVLSRNNLAGSLPTEFGRLTGLTSLDMSNNNDLTGTIPTELGLLTNLEIIKLGSNVMTGSIPTELGNCVLLNTMHFDRNQFTGPLPTELGLLTSLSELNVRGNQLSGTIPTEIGLLANITWIEIARNKMSGTFPTELGQCSALVQVGVQENQFSGNLTEILCGRGTVFFKFWSDCLTPNVTCSCCTNCCDGTDYCPPNTLS